MQYLLSEGKGKSFLGSFSGADLVISVFVGRPTGYVYFSTFTGACPATLTKVDENTAELSYKALWNCLRRFQGPPTQILARMLFWALKKCRWLFAGSTRTTCLIFDQLSSRLHISFSSFMLILGQVVFGLSDISTTKPSNKVAGGHWRTDKGPGTI